MSATSGNLSNDTPPSIQDSPNLNAVIVFAALADPGRWRIINLLASGQSLSGTEIAVLFKKSADAVNKQMRVLRDAGLVECRFAEDRRFFTYQIPASARSTPGILDFGICSVRLNHAMPDVVKD